MKQQMIEIAKTLARVFFGTLIAALLASGAGVLEWDTWAEWTPVLWACGVAVGTAILNSLNWKDPRYGVGASSE